MTLFRGSSSKRPLWASALATGCFIAMFGMFGVTVGLVSGGAIVLVLGSVLVGFGLTVCFFGGYVFFLNRPATGTRPDAGAEARNS